MTNPISPARALINDPTASPEALRDCLREVIAACEQAMGERDSLRRALSTSLAAGRSANLDGRLLANECTMMRQAQAAISPVSPAVAPCGSIFRPTYGWEEGRRERDA